VILKGAEVPGPHQPSATRSKRSMRPSLCWEWEWETDLPCRDTEGQSSSSVHSGHIVDRVLAASEVKGSVLPNVLSGCTWSRPLEVCIVVGPSQSWRRWPQGSLQELGLSLVSGFISVIQYLKCHFHKISLEGLRATFYLFKFSLNIREGLGNKMRVENNYSILGRWVSCQVISYAWVRYLNSLI
jgi:hypothetical protein